MNLSSVAMVTTGTFLAFVHRHNSRPTDRFMITCALRWRLWTSQSDDGLQQYGWFFLTGAWKWRRTQKHRTAAWKILDALRTFDARFRTRRAVPEGNHSRKANWILSHSRRIRQRELLSGQNGNTLIDKRYQNSEIGTFQSMYRARRRNVRTCIKRVVDYSLQTKLLSRSWIKRSWIKKRSDYSPEKFLQWKNFITRILSGFMRL